MSDEASISSARRALKSYKEKPTESNKAKLVYALQKADAANPMHINGGYYRDTKNMLDRGNEMIGRGNNIRGFLNKYLGTPINAVKDTVSAPFKAIGRTLDKNVNLGFDNVEDLKNNDNSDVKHNTRAASELLDLISVDRPDPTKNWEALGYLHKNMKNNTASIVPDVALKTISSASHGGLYIPYVSESIQDAISAPHTELFNAKGWNGKSRKEYMKEQEKSANIIGLIKAASRVNSSRRYTDNLKGLIKAALTLTDLENDPSRIGEGVGTEWKVGDNGGIVDLTPKPVAPRVNPQPAVQPAPAQPTVQRQQQQTATPRVSQPQPAAQPKVSKPQPQQAPQTTPSVVQPQAQQPVQGTTWTVTRSGRPVKATPQQQQEIARRQAARQQQTQQEQNSRTLTPDDTYKNIGVNDGTYRAGYVPEGQSYAPTSGRTDFKAKEEEHLNKTFGQAKVEKANKASAQVSSNFQEYMRTNPQQTMDMAMRHMTRPEITQNNRIRMAKAVINMYQGRQDRGEALSPQEQQLLQKAQEVTGFGVPNSSQYARYNEYQDPDANLPRDVQEIIGYNPYMH